METSRDLKPRTLRSSLDTMSQETVGDELKMCLYTKRGLKCFVLTGCRRDQDGYYWITGRIDDMLNVSGKDTQKLIFVLKVKC